MRVHDFVIPELEAQNAKIRQRWVSDPSFRESQKAKCVQVVAQKKVERAHNFGAWIRAFCLLNLDEKSVSQGKREARHKMDLPDNSG